MSWSFYWPLIRVMIFKNRSNQIESIQLNRWWEESKTVKVSNLRPEKTTTDLGGKYCNGIITMSPNSFNVQSSVIAQICLLLSNQAKRHIAPGCQLVDVTMNSPSPNGFCSCFPPQTKYFNSPKFSLLIILLSSSPQCTKYFPSPNFSPPFPSLVFSSSSMGTKYFLFQIISSPSFSVLLLLFYCQHLHNKNWNDNKIFALVTWPSLDIFSCPGQLNR